MLGPQLSLEALACCWTFRCHPGLCLHVCESREPQRGGFHFGNLVIWGLEPDLGFNQPYVYYLNMSN